MEIQYTLELKDLLAHYELLEYPAAEIGVAEGRFSLDLLSWGFPKVLLVDAWMSFPEKTGDISSPQQWHENNLKTVVEKTQKFYPRVSILRGLSVDMAGLVNDASLGFIYLDAGHSYEDVLADLHAWFPKLMTGGVMAGHDYLTPAYGIKRAVADFTAGRYDVHLIPQDKDEDAGFWFLKDK